MAYIFETPLITTSFDCSSGAFVNRSRSARVLPSKTSRL